MKKLNFVQLKQGDENLFQIAKKLWVPFVEEVNKHDGCIKSEGEIIDGLKKRIAIQGKRNDMHFEIAFCGAEPIGIAMFAIDLGTVYGLFDKGYGTIMGFFIRTDYRRKGFGKEFYRHIEKVLHNDGTSNMYLCPDSVTGIPFWSALGFVDSGKIDPDDNKHIYVKDISI